MDQNDPVVNYCNKKVDYIISCCFISLARKRIELYKTILVIKYRSPKVNLISNIFYGGGDCLPFSYTSINP